MTKSKSAVLIKGARIFDGKSPEILEGSNVLIENKKIARIAINITAPDGTTVIGANGKVLMPGLIDAHWHATYANLSEAEMLQADARSRSFPKNSLKLFNMADGRICT